MTDTDPSASAECRFFSTAFRLAIDWTPIASTSDRMAGSPSGTAATASDTRAGTSTILQRGHPVQNHDRGHHQGGDADHQQPQRPGDPGDLHLSGVGAAPSLQEARDLADLGVHAGGGDHGVPPRR